MPEIIDFRGHSVFYRTYHCNRENIAIHFVCCPMILLSTISYFIGNVIFTSYPYLTVGVATAWAHAIYYMLQDWQLGIPTAMILAVFTHFQRAHYSEFHSSISTSQFAVAQLIGWGVQFYGHKVHENRAPPLGVAFLQTVILAPFFVVCKIAFWLGFRPEAKKEMDDRAGMALRELIEREQKKEK